MKKNIYMIAFIIIGTTFLLVFTAILAEENLDKLLLDDILIIVSKENNLDISIDDIKSIYMGDKKFWSNHKKIVSFNRNLDTEVGIAFLKRVLHITPSRYRLHWKKLELSGENIEPTKIDDPKILIQTISTREEAIGYTFRSEVTEADLQKIRVVLVIKE